MPGYRPLELHLLHPRFSPESSEQGYMQHPNEAEKSLRKTTPSALHNGSVGGSCQKNTHFRYQAALDKSARGAENWFTRESLSSARPKLAFISIQLLNGSCDLNTPSKPATEPEDKYRSRRR